MRIAVGISYKGTHYHGWQTQAKLRTIQWILETAIAKVADHTVALTCAGRTDKGVHATGQVAHFDTDALRSPKAWILGINSHLPNDIRVNWIRELGSDFHARFSAMARRYRYLIYNKPIAHALWNAYTTYCYYPLDVPRMQSAANYLIGEHDFSSFRAASCQSKSTHRNLQHLKITYVQANIINIDIQANAFLHHMVRNIVGVLLLIGSGRREPKWAEAVLLAKDRKKAAATASANGLYLSAVCYPEKFCIPCSSTEVTLVV